MLACGLAATASCSSLPCFSSQFVANSAEVLCIPEDDALLLLQYFKWDDQKLQGLFYDKTDEVRKAAQDETPARNARDPATPHPVQIRKGAGLTAGKDPPSPPTGVPCVRTAARLRTCCDEAFTVARQRSLPSAHGPWTMT